MVDIEKLMEKIKKDLEKLEEKQDKINYLQKLYKETQNNEFKEALLDLLEELLEEDTLDEYIEPVRIRHEVMEEFHRPNPMAHVVENISFRRPMEEQEQEEEIKYTLTDSKYDTSVRDILTNTSKNTDNSTRYMNVESVEKKLPYQENKQTEDRYQTTQTERITEGDTDPFSIESLLRDKNDKHLKKNLREAKW